MMTRKPEILDSEEGRSVSFLDAPYLQFYAVCPFTPGL